MKLMVVVLFLYSISLQCMNSSKALYSPAKFNPDKHSLEKLITVMDTNNVAPPLLTKRSKIPNKECIVERLLQFGADKEKVNQCNRFIEQYSSLYGLLLGAIAQKKEDLFNILIDANIQEPNCFAQIPFHHAALTNSFEAVKSLVARDENVNRTDLEGRTALMKATRMGNAQMVDLLLLLKADFNIKDDFGTTALDFAYQKGHKEIVKILKNAGARIGFFSYFRYLFR